MAREAWPIKSVSNKKSYRLLITRTWDLMLNSNYVFLYSFVLENKNLDTCIRWQCLFYTTQYISFITIMSVLLVENLEKFFPNNNNFIFEIMQQGQKYFFFFFLSASSMVSGSKKLWPFNLNKKNIFPN